jgi:peptide/nickel transport system substrate-binding protein
MPDRKKVRQNAGVEYREDDPMKPYLRALAATGSLALVLVVSQPVLAQKQGGVLRLYSPASPASMSNLEEATIVAEMPTMGVFNNLILFDQHVPQVSLHSIKPELATSWAWNEDGTELTFQLRQGIKWHDGKPFTAQDVTCTWALYQDKAPEKLRVNPRKSTYDNVDRVTTNGDFEVTFHLKRPQPAFPMLLAGGFTSPIYPCHCHRRKCAPIRSAPGHSSLSNSSPTNMSK